MFWLLFSVLFYQVEQTSLDELRVTVLLDAAQADDKVLFYYFDIGEGGLSNHYILYDFNSGKAHKLNDGRIDFRSDAIVHQNGIFYIENSEQVLAIDANGNFLEKIRLNTFDGWESDLRVDSMEHYRNKVIALCSMVGVGDRFLVELDFNEKTALIKNIDFSDGNPYVESPDFMIVPYQGQYLRFEPYTREIVLLTAQLKREKVISKAKAPVEVRNNRKGVNQMVQIYTKPFIATGKGVTGKFLNTFDKSGEKLKENTAGGFLISDNGAISLDEKLLIIANYNGKDLVWNRTEATIFIK